MNKLNFYIIFCLFFFAAEIIYPSDIPATSIGEITFYVDNASFKTVDNYSFVEFYIMLFADQLMLQEKNGKKFAVFNVITEIKSDNKDSSLISGTWETEVSIKDSINIKELAVYDQWNEKLAPGNYKVKLKISDKNSTNSGTAEFDLSVPKIEDETFSGSSIQFISGVTSAAEGNFVKLNQAITPNPSRRYGILKPILYFYYELYNLPGAPGEKFNIDYSLTDSDNKTVKNFPEKNFEKESGNISFIHGLNVASVKSGIYNFNIKISQLSSEEEIILSRPIEILQAENLAIKNQNYLNEEESETAGNLLKYIATPEQIDFYESLNLQGKKEFLITFWKNLDPTPGTLENEYLEKIKQRYNYANENFNWAGIEGWKTERGRILIQYGMPDEIERHHYESGSLPYEIWAYTAEREYLFVFGDLRSDGRFTLLHSNKEGEIFNNKWMQFLRRM